MYKHILKGGTLFTIGYLLSPVSLWDDLFVNVPISYVLALVVKHFSPSAFLPSLIIIYCLTNFIGFLCMRKGIKHMKQMKGGNVKNEVIKDVAFSIICSIGMIGLVKLNILQITF